MLRRNGDVRGDEIERGLCIYVYVLLSVVV